MATNEVMSGPGPTMGQGAPDAGPSGCPELTITTVRSAADHEAAAALLRCHGGPEGGSPTSGAARPGEASRLLLARRGAEPVGVARICWGVARRAGEVRRGQLTHLYVRPEARARGVGEALVRRAGVVAWWSGCQDVRVRTTTWPAPAVALLRRAGFGPLDVDGASDELVLVTEPVGPASEQRPA